MFDYLSVNYCVKLFGRDRPWAMSTYFSVSPEADAGYGFLVFRSSADAEAALKKQMYIDGQLVEMRPYLPPRRLCLNDALFPAAEGTALEQ